MNEGVDREPRREPPPEDVAGDPGEEPRRPRRKRRHERFRVPAWVILFLGPLTGWVIADMLGAILGLVIGVVAWRSRA